MPDSDQSVRPLDESGRPIEATPSTGRRGAIVGGVVIALVVFAAVAAVALYRSFVGDAFAAADAVPVDAQVVVGFDLFQLRDSERLQELVDAFAEPLAAAGEIESADVDVVETIDAGLQEEIGLDLSNDIFPWIGRSVSIAVWPTSESLLTGRPDVLLSAAVRDADAADRFVEDLTAALAGREGGVVEETTIAGEAAVSVTAPQPDAEPLVVLRTGDLLLASNSESAIERGLAASNGESLADDGSFQEAMGALPTDRFMSVYVAGGLFADAVADPGLGPMTPDLGMVSDTFDGLEAGAGSLTLSDDGVEIDFFQFFEPGSPAANTVATDLRMASRLSADTIGFIDIPIPEDLLTGLAGLATLAAPDPTEALDMVGGDLGLDAVAGLLPVLGRELLVAAVATDEGALPVPSALPVGVVAGIGVSDAEPVNAALEDAADLAGQFGVAVQQDGPVSVVLVEGAPVAAFAVTDDALWVGTSPDEVSGLVAGTPNPIASVPAYADLDSILPGDDLMVFVDVPRALDVAGIDEAQRSFADPIRAAGLGAAVDDDRAHAKVAVLIDY